MPKDVGDPNDWVCDDPDKSRGDSCMISADVVKKRNLYTDKNLWAKAKNLKRKDIWSASGFGDASPNLMTWTQTELDELGQTFGAQLGVRYNGAMKFGICCSCG